MENIDEEIALPENATNVGRLTELSREKEEKEAALTETMEQWEQLIENPVHQLIFEVYRRLSRHAEVSPVVIVSENIEIHDLRRADKRKNK